jgi:hypothetical protein
LQVAVRIGESSVGVLPATEKRNAEGRNIIIEHNSIAEPPAE